MEEKTIDFFKQKCCGTCFHNQKHKIASGTYCDLTSMPTRMYQPICTRYLNVVDELRRVQEIEETKTNFVLTLMFNSMAACMNFLSYYEQRMNFFQTKGSWAKEKRYAMMKMSDHVSQIRTYYNRFFKPDVIRVTKETADSKAEGEQRYKDVHDDTYELCRLLMHYVDKCFGNRENLDKLFKCFAEMPGEEIFEKKDYDEFTVHNYHSGKQ